MKNKKAASKPKAKEKNNTLGLLVLLLLASGTFATVSLLKNGTGMFTKAASKNKPPVFCTDLTVVPQTGSAPLEVSATVSGTSKGGDKIYSYAFDFGDGTSLVKSSTPTQTHLYEKPGNFVAKGYVMAKISGQVGGTDKCAKNITVNAGTISLDRTSVTETLDVANADVNSGLIFGNGFNITSEGATGFQIKDISNDGRIRQGEGFYESSGGMVPGQTVNIRSYLNSNKTVGTYEGVVMVEYYKNGVWNEGESVRYSLTLIDTTTPISVDKENVTVTFKRSDYPGQTGLVYTSGFNLTSNTANGWSLKRADTDDRIRQGEGFYESSGGITPGSAIPIRAYINLTKPNGTYTGVYQVQYSDDGNWYPSDVYVRYSINLID